jgi:hypothetical protein
MPGIGDEGNVNPLDSGNDPNSVEASAADFTRMLEAEAAPRPRRKSETEETAPRQAAPAPQGDNERDAAPADERPSSPDDTLFDDPILDDTPPKKPGDEDEDEDADPDADAEGDEEGEGDEGDDDEEILDREFEVTVAGKTEALPLKEIIAGYSREADYRQKTARLSEERQEVEAFAEETVQQRQHYDAKLTEFIETAKAFELSDEDWDKLAQADPKMFLDTRKQWDGISKKVEEAKAERDRIAQQVEQDALRNYSRYVKEQDEKMFSAIPALRNPEKAKQFRSTLLDYGKKAGYTEEELRSGLVDARDIQTMYKAARYDAIMEARKGGNKPAKGKGAKPATPRPAPSSQPRVISRNVQGTRTDTRRAERQLARSGSQDDAAMAFTSLINSGRI